MNKSYLVVDIETGSTEKFGRKGHFLYNDLVAIGTISSLEGKNVTYLYPNRLQSLDIKEDVLVGHNIKFDLLHLWKIPGVQEFLNRGGLVYDTMLAEYFITAQQSKFPGLRETAEKYGCEPREKLMEAFWDSGVNTIDIPVTTVLNDLEGDIDDTEQVYLRQLNLLTPQQDNLLTVQNRLLLAVTEMEYNGMYVNKQILIENMRKLEAELKQKTSQFSKLVGPYWELKVLPKFNPSSLDHMSLLLFGGTLGVTVKEPALNPDGSVYVFKTGARKREIKLVNVERDIIIKGLGLSPIGEANKKGIYPTNEGVLQELLKQGRNEILELILENRGLNKLLGTYYKGTLELTDDDSCVHANFIQVKTTTGRSSCTKPNLQNMPNEGHTLEHFTSRYSDEAK